MTRYKKLCASVGLVGLGFMAACTPQTTATLVADGQLFCTYQGTTVSIYNAAVQKPYSVINQASEVVAAACAAWQAGAKPVMPPATTVPSVAIVPPPA